MRQKRKGFSRIGMVCVVLMMALGITGTAYGAWSDTVTIGATVNMGTFGAEVTCDECSPCGIGCIGEIGSNELELTVTCAEVGVTYSCGFEITNTGTIPVRIQSIDILDVPEGVVVSVDGLVEVGHQIEPGGASVGIVQVSLPAYTPPEVNPSEGETFTFTVTFEFVPWNQYIP